MQHSPHTATDTPGDEHQRHRPSNEDTTPPTATPRRGAPTHHCTRTGGRLCRRRGVVRGIHRELWSLRGRGLLDLVRLLVLSCRP